MNTAIARRKPNENKILEIRSLTTADLDLLRRPVGSHFPIKVIRQRHHHIAWLIAMGRSNIDIAAELHMSPNRISQCRSDPSMQELIAKKFAEIESARQDAAIGFATAAVKNMTAAEALLDRALTEAAADPAAAPSLTTLNRIAVDRMDRFGYPKHTTSDNRNTNVNFAANLEAAIKRSRSPA